MTASVDIDSAACACIGVKDILSAGSNGRMSSDVSQWVSLARSLRSSDLSGLDKSLASKSYLVGNALSIADAAVYVALMTTKGIDVSGYKNVTRFILHVQKMVKSVAGVKALPESTRPTFIPLKLKATSTPAAATKAPLIEGGKKKEEKKEKKGKEGENGGKAAAAPADGGDLNPFLLDIRVGEIVKCWNHPDSEKLLCEEVDLGEEGGPRNIASGIRAHYSAEEFMGKKVMVLANLKDRAIAGFKSQGMVLCACNEDHSKVKIVEPPTGAKKGDRVMFSGAEECEAASGSQMGKKKILEKLAPLLKTDDKGLAFCGKHQMKIGEGSVTSLLPSAAIS